MKIACILLKNWISEEDEGERSVIRSLEENGYTFEEIRILRQADGEKLRREASSLKQEYDLLFVLGNKSALSVARGYLSGAFPNSCAQTGDGELFIDGTNAAFLLATDGDGAVAFTQTACAEYLHRKQASKRESVILRAIGASAARVQALLAEIGRFAAGKITVRHTRRFDEDQFLLFYDATTPKVTVDEVVRYLMDGLGDTVYALNDVTVEERLLSLLKLRGKKLSVAESFTGGGIAKRIASVSGASEVYFEGLNVYNERAKVKRLGVSEYGLRLSGAASEQVAYEMALGLLNTGDCDISIATTGIAGPKSDRSLLPVGLCFIAVGTKEKVYVYRYQLDGDRKEITEKAINYALFLAYKQLKDI